jgi:transcriptional regulator GlxA family with amidase domain
VDDLTDESSSDADRLHVESLVFELIPERTSTHGAAWLDSVRECLRQGYREPVSLGALAREVDRHPAHLVRSFRSASGMTPGEYLRRLRVAAAIRLLRETDQPVAAVAVRSGFSDQSHMGRWLRRYVKRTPLEVRRGAEPPAIG